MLGDLRYGRDTMNTSSTQKHNSATLAKTIAQSKWLTPTYMTQRQTAELGKIVAAQEQLDAALSRGTTTAEIYALDSSGANVVLANLLARVTKRYYAWVLENQLDTPVGEPQISVKAAEKIAAANKTLRSVEARIAAGEASERDRSLGRWMRWAGIAMRNQAESNALERRVREAVEARLSMGHALADDFYYLSQVGLLSLYGMRTSLDEALERDSHDT